MADDERTGTGGEATRPPQASPPESQRDSDRDGITDAKEREIGTNPHASDTDGDGISDADELFVTRSDPRRIDTDGDGITDAKERQLGTRADKTDSDDDGLSDWDELTRHRTDPTKRDADGDGLIDSTEVALGLDSRKADSDGDGVDDLTQHWRAAGLTVGDLRAAGEARERGERIEVADRDRDGLSDALEEQLGTDPDKVERGPDGLTSGQRWRQLNEELREAIVFREVEKDAWLHARMRGETDLEPNAWLEAQTKAGVVYRYDDDGNIVRQTSEPGSAPARAGGPGPAPDEQPAQGGEDAPVAGTSPVEVFLRNGLAARGTPFSRRSSADVDDPSPDSFDASELVKWAAGRAGVSLRDGSWRQYQQLHGMGQTDTSVEAALQTPGALVFHFSRDPLASDGRPPEAHVAISLGDGRVLEATTGGVRIADAAGRFEYAATVPQFEGASLESMDVDRDGLSDKREIELDTDRFDHDTDDDFVFDGQEVDADLDPNDPDSDDDGRLDWEDITDDVLGPLPGTQSTGGAAPEAGAQSTEVEPATAPPPDLLTEEIELSADPPEPPASPDPVTIDPLTDAVGTDPDPVGLDAGAAEDPPPDLGAHEPE